MTRVQNTIYTIAGIIAVAIILGGMTFFILTTVL